MALQQITSDMITDANVLTQHIANLNVTPAKLSQPLTQGTSVATTSGTFVDFTGIPAWAKRITVILNAVGTNGTSQIQIQLGTSSGIQATGYTGCRGGLGNPNIVAVEANTNGLGLTNAISPSESLIGNVIITSPYSNLWVSSFIGAAGTTTTARFGSGAVLLTGALDRLRLTTVGGTDTFDSGSVNIFWE